MSQVQLKIESKIGPLYLVATEDSLQGIFWKEQEIPMITKGQIKAHSILVKTILQLEEYFIGKRKFFNLPLNAEGTKFQKQVWEELSKIPYGQTRSYKDIATALKDKNASRAVGSANGKNPISIVVPCHRVIASDGTLGGFAGGLDAKEKLLALERGWLVSNF